MRYEKIIKRDSGDQHLISVEFVTSSYFHNSYGEYRVSTAHKGPRKRTWIYGYYPEITNVEIYQAKLELWENLKPELLAP